MAIQSLRKTGFLSESQSEVLVIDPDRNCYPKSCVFHDKICHNKACFVFFTKSEQLALAQVPESSNYRQLKKILT